VSVSIRQLYPVFAGEAAGVNLTKAISRADAIAIEDRMDRYDARRWLP